MIFLSLFLLIFSSACFQLPVCVFLLAFLFKKTWCVFSDFNSSFYTHFSLICLSISFRFVFFCLLSSLKNTYRVFSDFDSCFYTHFSLIYLPISFRFVFSCLLSSSKKHGVCFLTSILAFSHTFPFSTWQSASGLCFSACFSLKKQLSKYVRQTYSFPALILLIIRHPK